MSLASDYAAAVAVDDDAEAAVELLKPPGITVGPFTLNVSRSGGMNISGGRGDEDLSLAEVAEMGVWFVATFQD